MNHGGQPGGAKAEGRGIDIAGLQLEAGPIDGAAVETRRSSGLEAAAAETKLLEGFAEEDGSRFAGASRGVLLFAAMDQAI